MKIHATITTSVETIAIIIIAIAISVAATHVVMVIFVATIVGEVTEEVFGVIIIKVVEIAIDLAVTQGSLAMRQHLGLLEYKVIISHQLVILAVTIQIKDPLLTSPTVRSML
jgi:hypothetical protein